MTPIRTQARAAEVSWFSALCNDDYELLGVPTGELRSSFEHCRDIVVGADRISLAPVRDGIRALQDGACFYCCEPLEKACHVP